MLDNTSTFHDSEAEKIVLGSMMVDSAVIPDVVRLLGLTNQAFFTVNHQLLYSSILTTYERNGTTDPLLVADHLKKEKHLNRVGGVDYLYELQSAIVETENTKFYTEILLEKSIRRNLIEASVKVKDFASDENITLKEAINNSQELIFEITQSDSHRGLAHIHPFIIQSIDNIERAFQDESPIVGISTGFREFDEMTSGLHPGQLIIIAARPSKGKTTLVLNIAEHIASTAAYPVAFFSLEMSAEDISMRMLSAESHIDYRKLRDGSLTQDQWPQLISAMEKLQGGKMFVNDNMRGTIQDIRAESRRVRDEQGKLSVIIIDYLQLVKGSGNRYNMREQEISEISRTLKGMAAELDVPIIACSQLNREIEKRPGKEPQLSDIRESGAIEQDADLVAFLHEADDVDEDSHTYDRVEMELLIKKHRNGPTGRVPLYFHKKQMRFENPKQ